MKKLLLLTALLAGCAIAGSSDDPVVPQNIRFGASEEEIVLYDRIGEPMFTFDRNAVTNNILDWSNELAEADTTLALLNNYADGMAEGLTISLVERYSIRIN